MGTAFSCPSVLRVFCTNCSYDTFIRQQVVDVACRDRQKQPGLVLAHTTFVTSSLVKHQRSLWGAYQSMHFTGYCLTLLRGWHQAITFRRRLKAPEVPVQQRYPKAVLSRSLCDLAYHTIRCSGYSISASQTRNKVNGAFGIVCAM